MADFWAKNCHVPHRVEPDIYPFQLDKGRAVLSDYYRKGYPFTPKWQIGLTTNTARFTAPKRNGISSVGGSLGAPRSDSNSRAISRHLETTWAAVKKLPIQVTKPAALTPLRKREVPQLQQGLPGTASLPSFSIGA